MLKRVWIGLALIFALFFFVTTIEKGKEKEISLPQGESNASLYANPSTQDLEKSVTSLIYQAKKSVTLAIFSLSDSKVIQALRTQADNGIEVFVVIDKNASRYAPKYLGKNVHVIRRNLKALMHLKVLVIDGKITLIGSANMTRESLHIHANLMTLISSEPLSNGRG